MNRADIIIIGGGVMGTASALFLTLRSKSVILLESDFIGRKASGTNFGAVRRQGRAFHQLPLANRSREIWGKLPELLGENCEFVSRGQLRVGKSAEDVDRMAEYAAEARQYGLHLEMISGNALRSRYPWLGTHVHGGSLSPTDGHANPRLTGPAFGRAAARAGALILENAPVVSAARHGAEFEVFTENGREFTAPVCLLTAGAWSGCFARAFGEEVALDIKGPQMTVTEPVPYVIAPAISVSTRDFNDHVYFRQVERGNIIIGGPTHGPASIETGFADVRPEIVLLQLSKTRDLLPLLAKVRVIRTWSGVESYTADGQPVMGASPTVPGLFYAYGFSGAGFQLGPGVGHVMAELIATGKTDVPLEAYAADRFAGREIDMAEAARMAVLGKG